MFSLKLLVKQKFQNSEVNLNWYLLINVFFQIIIILIFSQIRGFLTDLQGDNNNSSVHVNKLPSNPRHEAITHLDLSLDYMEIVDKVRKLKSLTKK